jgi:hypothetical protein
MDDNDTLLPVDNVNTKTPSSAGGQAQRNKESTP